MKWCCMGFEGHVSSAGSRGSAIFASSRDGQEPDFILQFRATDPGSQIQKTDSMVSLITDLHIQFCPWCGVNLKQWYRDTFREFDRPELQVPM